MGSGVGPLFRTAKDSTGGRAAGGPAGGGRGGGGGRLRPSPARGADRDKRVARRDGHFLPPPEMSRQAKKAPTPPIRMRGIHPTNLSARPSSTMAPAP